MKNAAVEKEPAWVETLAVVTGCRYQFARINTLTFGIRTGEKFRIGFDYYAHGKLYSDEFQSPVAIAQDERIAIAYNPLKPEQNSRTRGASTSGRLSLAAVGIAGPIVLSLLWLALMRGCG